MSSLRAMQLLSKTAVMALDQQQSFSKESILQKMHEIKYLSSQKKVPRLTLRKEVIHLENQLQKVLEVEQRRFSEKNKEPVVIAALKQQIEILKNKLKLTRDSELDEKVNHLSFLLGEHLAMREMPDKVALSEMPISKNVEGSEMERDGQAEISTKADEAVKNTTRRIEMVERRLNALKQELEIHRELGTKNSQELAQLEENIIEIEDKLRAFYEQHPETMRQEVGTVEFSGEVRHDLLFPQTESKEEVTKGAQNQLPLPPPPRMKNRKNE